VLQVPCIPLVKQRHIFLKIKIINKYMLSGMRRIGKKVINHV
jgi:hypothetical protein